jgi:spermidine synthase
MKKTLYLAFFLSGVAGLIYESIWSRYLGLFVGHSAYAQVIVLTIFLGGLSLGAILVGERSEKTRRPLFWYAGAEALVGLFGLFFHDIFLMVQEMAYGGIFPALSGTPFLTPVKWLLVAGLILPPSTLLGTTFPFMSAGFLRLFPSAPGRVLSLLYFTNSFGAALGALLAGFVLLGQFGLPGTILVAAVLNVTVALLAWGVEKRSETGEVLWSVRSEEGGAAAPGRHGVGGAGRFLTRESLWRLLLGVSFGTALASFIYEIAWIRMLSLVLGTATHSFELMLSAFILGLALGAFWIRGRADAVADPIRTLGWIQWIMGAAALATLPLYVASFEWTVDLLSAVNRTPSGYTLFNLSRYGMALVVMLPATFCAGTTLPLITRTLLSAGEGERAIGWVYGVNTLGSILAVGLASLLLLPLIGVKPLLVLGGGLDMAIGVFLLTLAGKTAVGEGGEGTKREGRRGGAGLATALGASVMVLLALFGVRMDQALLSSGVYRTGRLPGAGTEVVYYKDGRTATVTADRKPPGVLSLSTNGKPDATLTEAWLGPMPESPSPLSLDEPTQILLAMVTLAHNPGAKQGVVVGQGSGLSSHMLLGSPNLESLTTVEIEPEMIRASQVFLPATRRVFEDPRSHFVIDDAKSFLAQGGPPLDLILSEPSNPWVSGVASLFSSEFYGRVKERLAPGGVFGQWLHLYEINDGLVLSVLGALHEHFPDYQIYMVHSADMLIVAGRDAEMRRPDWGVFDFPQIRGDLDRTYPFDPAFLEAARFLNREGLAPLLDDWPSPNSDFFPILDLGAERTRFLQTPASGFLGSSSSAFDVADFFLPRTPGMGAPLLTPVPQIAATRALALRNSVKAHLGLLENSAVAGDLDVTVDLDLRQAVYRYQQARALMEMEEAPVDWMAWLRDVLIGIGWGQLTGWEVYDADLVLEVEAAAFGLGAPWGVAAALAFVRTLEERDWSGLLQPTDLLAAEIAEGRLWVNPSVVLDVGVLARIQAGTPGAAGDFFSTLAPLSGRSFQDFRMRLLQAHLDRALSVR